MKNPEGKKVFMVIACDNFRDEEYLVLRLEKARCLREKRRSKRACIKTFYHSVRRCGHRQWARAVNVVHPPTLFKISRAATTPEIDAWISPRVTPAPSPIANRFFISVSRQDVSLSLME